MAKTFLLFLLFNPLLLFSQASEKQIPVFIQKRITSAENETDNKKQFAEAIQLLKWGKENNNAYVSAKAYQVIADVYRPQRGKRLFEADSLFEYYASVCDNKLLYFEALRLHITDLLNDNIVKKAKSFIDRADTLVGNNATTYEKCVLNQLKGFYYYKKIDPKTAISFYQRSVAYADSANNTFLKARSFSGISSCYIFRMNNDSASWYLFQALAIHQKTSDFFEIASDYDNLGFLFKSSANKMKAQEYYSEAIRNYKKANAPVNIGYTNLTVGEMYIGWKQTRDALPYLQNARSQFEALHYEQGLSLSYSLLSRYYAQLKDADSADFYSAKAKSISAPGQSVVSFYAAAQAIAKEAELGNYKKSDSLLKIISPKTERMLPDESIAKAANKATAGSNNSDSLNTSEPKSRNSNVNVSLATDVVINPFSGLSNTKDSLINSLLHENEKIVESVDSFKRQLVRDSLYHANQQLVLKEKELKIKNLSLLAFSIVLVASGFIIYYVYQSRKKINREKEYTLHYAKGNLSIINANIADISRNSTAPKDFEILKQKIFPLNSLYKFLEEKLTDKIYMTDYLNEICAKISQAYSLNRNIKTVVDAPVYLQGKKAQTIGFIVNELVTNSFKYAFSGMPNGEINVICKQQQKGYQLLVADDGNGFDESTVTKGQGIELVGGLTQQLSASMKKINTDGTQFEFYFF